MSRDYPGAELVDLHGRRNGLIIVHGGIFTLAGTLRNPVATVLTAD